MSFSKILIAVDSSEYSLSAAKTGIDLARQLSAQLALIFVVDNARTIHSADAGITPEESIVILKKEAQETLDQIIRMFHVTNSIKFMPEGHPTEDIIKTAEIWNADLIVLGTHGRTGLIHLLKGSVVEHVLRQSKIPVMVVPFKL
jgi:nucleotide-binding universal stress UspA family protein